MKEDKNTIEKENEETGAPICPKCGNIMILEDGEWVCPHCQGEIDFLGDDDE
jgi:transposase